MALAGRGTNIWWRVRFGVEQPLRTKRTRHDAVSEDAHFGQCKPRSVHSTGSWLNLSSTRFSWPPTGGHVTSPGLGVGEVWTAAQRASLGGPWGGNQLPARRSWTLGGAWAAPTGIPGARCHREGWVCRLVSWWCTRSSAGSTAAAGAGAA